MADLTNDDRANLAKSALKQFFELTTDCRDDMEDALVDMLTDAMHLAKREGLHFPRVMAAAASSFHEEAKKPERKTYTVTGYYVDNEQTWASTGTGATEQEAVADAVKQLCQQADPELSPDLINIVGVIEGSYTVSGPSVLTSGWRYYLPAKNRKDGSCE